MKTEDIKAQID